MGKEIEQLALERKHQVIVKYDSEKDWSDYGSLLKEADIAIEFSMPDTVIPNIKRCFENGIPVVTGTTGWDDQTKELIELCRQSGNSIFIAANFNVWVNIFFEINKRLAAMMNKQQQYDIIVEEIHHIQKIDQPSGTAIKLAQDILQKLDKKTKWVNSPAHSPNELEIKSIREDQVAGIHLVKYESENDELEIKHEARSRKGFAEGALMAAEWLIGKRGVFGMSDMLGL